ncbi:MAG: hypothetical protein ACLU93_08910 [Streptococcus sp.]
MDPQQTKSEPSPENKPDKPEHQPEVAPDPEQTGQNNNHDNTSTVPNPSRG